MQAIFFFVSALLFAVLFFTPIVEFYGETNMFTFNVVGVETMLPDGRMPFPEMYAFPVLILTLTAVILGGYVAMKLFRAVNLSQFRHVRKMGRIYLYVIIAWIVLVFGFYSFTIGRPIGASPTYKLGAFPPLVSLVMAIIAIVGVNKDIKKIRSVDRLR